MRDEGPYMSRENGAKHAAGGGKRTKVSGWKAREVFREDVVGMLSLGVRDQGCPGD